MDSIMMGDTFINTFFSTLKMFVSPSMFQGAKGTIFGIFLVLLGVVFAALMAAAYIGSAVVSKKGRVVGIIAGIANALVALAAPIYVIMYHHLKFNIYYVDLEDVIQDLITNLIIAGGASIINGIALVSFVITLVYVIMCIKRKPAICGVFALLIVIVRYFMITPYQSMVAFITKIAFELIEAKGTALTLLLSLGQTFQLVLYLGTLLIPALLVLISGIVDTKKGKAAIKSEAKTEAKAEVKAETKEAK